MDNNNDDVKKENTPILFSNKKTPEEQKKVSNDMYKWLQAIKESLEINKQR